MVLSVTIPDSVKDRVINALCSQHSYQATIEGEPNPETKTQFAKRMVIEYIKNNVKAYESSKDVETVRQSSLTKVEQDITLT